MPLAPAAAGDTLLDAALVTFDALGYSATPVPAIAAQAGIAVGSVYRRFPSKEALANALYRREKQRLAAALFDGIDAQAPASDTFACIWDRLTTYAANHADALCFLELHHHGAYLDAASEQLAADMDALVADLVRHWQARGEVRDGDPALLHAQVFGGFVAVLRQLRQRGELIDEQLGRQTMGPAWAMLQRP